MTFYIQKVKGQLLGDIILFDKNTSVPLILVAYLETVLIVLSFFAVKLNMIFNTFYNLLLLLFSIRISFTGKAFARTSVLPRAKLNTFY